MSMTLTKADIAESVYEKMDVTRVDAQKLVRQMLDVMKTSLKKDNSLLLSGFGKFEAYAKDEREGRNPQTNEKITLSPRKVVVFRLSRNFRDAINKDVHN